jgi:uncharacterized protein YcbK (DUF882 family)
VPIRAARRVLSRAGASRAGQTIGLAALALLLASQGWQSAVASGDTRTISFHHMHTGENLTVTYMRDGQYDPDALKKIDHELRDWRRNEEIHIDPRLIDAVWQAYHDVGATGPVEVVCGYRSPATNSMLRRRSRGVAKFSQHMLGHAMDFYLPGVPLEKLREAGLRLQRGGVGYYPTSGSPFVHMDVGNVRHWPRMTRAQLARVFPDGRTVHVPSDGRPLGGYALALADIQHRKSSSPSTMSLDAARNAGIEVQAPQHQPNIFTALFSSKDEDEDNETAAQPANQPARAEPKVAETKVATAKTRVAPVPLPVARPAARIARQAPKTSATFSLASAESEPAELGGPRVANAAPSANDLVARRGLWTTFASAPPPPTLAARRPVQQPVQVAAATPRPMPATPRETTGAVDTPWPVRIADAADRIPGELALSYAAQTKIAPQAPVTRSLTPTSAIPHDDATIPQARVVASAKPTPQIAATTPAFKTNSPLEDPWLRALVVAPNLQEFMTSVRLGQPDMRDLQPLMEKPATVVIMSFGADPNPGMTTNRFTGSAVVFLNTTTFAQRSVASQ